jgi:hypothetical protein
MIISSKTMQDNIILKTPYTYTELNLTEFNVEELQNKFSCHLKCFLYKDIELIYYWSFRKDDLILIETTYFRYNINEKYQEIDWNEIDNTLKNILLRNHLIINDTDLTGMHLAMMEAATEKETPGKMSKALSALF